ncbi:CaiB/BaiF CoA transferase family protein [Streptomyces sp. NPDC088812]|uniref:CaiB/BaiF CoA transferase family protein n=1 Tax=Streptomyces sp. NPDC088812 TaxID=3365905 RepID=UPI0038207C99
MPRGVRVADELLQSGAFGRLWLCGAELGQGLFGLGALGLVAGAFLGLVHGGVVASRPWSGLRDRVSGRDGLLLRPVHAATGAPDGPPFRAGISVFDVMTGLHSAIGILSALHHRDLTGEGQHVETNLLSTALSALVNQTSAYVAGGVVPHRMGNAHLSLFPYEPLQTGDGELIVVAGNDGQFRKLAAVIGRPELADDPRFDTVGKRNDNREQLRPLLLEALSTKSALDWFGILTEAGLPCGPINTVAGGVRLAEDLGLEPVVEVGEGDHAVPTVRHPIRLSRTPASYRLAPPALDEHGADVRAWLSAPREDDRG